VLTKIFKKDNESIYIFIQTYDIIYR